MMLLIGRAIVLNVLFASENQAREWRFVRCPQVVCQVQGYETVPLACGMLTCLAQDAISVRDLAMSKL